MPELSSHILSLRPSLLNAQDVYVWPLHSSGSYTAKSGYYVLTSTHLFQSSRLVLEDWNWKKEYVEPSPTTKIEILFMEGFSQCHYNK